MHIRGRQALATDCPVTALDFVEADPGNAPHILAFDAYHCVRYFLDHFPFLFRGKNIFDSMYLYVWHGITPYTKDL
jgi:hypothetical protein